MTDGDPFDLSSAMDLDLDPAPPRRAPPRFTPKVKGKLKSEPAPDPDPAPLAQPEQSTRSTSTTIATVPTPMDVDDEDDPVVREIDVYVSPLEEDDSKLHVMQYPLRPWWRPYELPERCEKVKVKPKHSKVELVLNVDADSEYFDQDAREDMRLQKQTLSSSRMTSAVGCATGILVNDQLHLNPIHEVLQFRPSMKHIDESGIQNKLHKTQEEKLVKENLSDQMNTAEPWISVEYKPTGSICSRTYQKKMMSKRENNKNFTMNPSEYVQSLCPQPPVEMKARVSLLSFLPTLPLEQRLKEWLCQGSEVNHFSALMYLDSTATEETFFNILKGSAFLVQGLWVSESSLKYQGHDAKLRDYILFLFSQNRVLKKRQLMGLSLGSDYNDGYLTKLLEPVAYYRISFHDWKFREEPDSSFKQKYPEIVVEQESAWFTRAKHLKRYLCNSSGHTEKSEKENKPNKKVGRKLDGGSKRINDRSGRSMATAMSNDNRELLKKAFFNILKDRNARSINLIRRELQDYALALSSKPKEGSKTKALVSAIAIAASGPSPDFLSVLNEVAIEIHNIYVLRSGENPELDTIRNVVLGLFSSKGANAKLKKQEILDAVKACLNRSISDNEYKQVLNDLCTSTKGAWELKRSNNTE